MLTHDTLIALVEEILEVSPGTVQDTDDLETLGWDSLCDLNLLSIADERFGVSIDPRALAEAETPEDLRALLVRAA